MTFIIVAYILWTSPAHKQAYGFGLPLSFSCALGAVIAIVFAICVRYLGKQKTEGMEE